MFSFPPSKLSYYAPITWRILLAKIFGTRYTDLCPHTGTFLSAYLWRNRLYVDKVILEKEAILDPTRVAKGTEEYFNREWSARRERNR